MNSDKNRKDCPTFVRGLSMHKIFSDTIINISDIIASTMGPSGKYAAIEKTLGKVYFTKDGVTVMKHMHSSDRYENMFINLMKEVCNKTNNKVGDGTTTTIVLLKALIEKSSHLMYRYSTRDISRGIVDALDKSISFIQKNTIKSNDDNLEKIAIIASGNDKYLGGLLHEAIKRVDPKYGYISVEEGKAVDTTLEINNGSVLNCGYASQHFITQKGHSSIEYENAMVFIFDGTLSDINITIKTLEFIASKGIPTVILAQDFEKNVLNNLIINNYQKIVKVVAVKVNIMASNINEILEDYSCIVGGQVCFQSSLFFDNNKNNDNYDPSKYVGYCQKVVVNIDSVLIMPGNIEHRIEDRCKEISYELDNKDIGPDRIEELKERYSRMQSTIAVIRVGAATGGEISEIRDRVVDAVSSIKSASYYGVSVGGGITLLKTAIFLSKDIISNNTNKGYIAGVQAVIHALKQVLYQIIYNADQDNYLNIFNEIIGIHENDINSYIGYNAIEYHICDINQSGVVDATQSLIVSLQGAVSICKMFLGSEVAIIKEINQEGPSNYFS